MKFQNAKSTFKKVNFVIEVFQKKYLSILGMRNSNFDLVEVIK